MDLNLTTERLLLRPATMAHLDLATELFTDPAVVKYVSKLMTPDEVADGLPKWINRGGGGCIGIWCATDRQTEERIGTGALLPMPIDEEDTNWDLIAGNEMPDGDVEVGYILKPSAWGKGYATEICLRLLQFAFEETSLREVVAPFDDEHLKSRRVLEKCGLIDKGRRLAHGEDSVDFRISRDQWIANCLARAVQI